MKVFIHLDMDCYYAQSESKRLNIDPEKPLCARQWNSLVAVNYAARALGVKRGMLAEEALKLNQNILLPHVDTFKIIDGKIHNSSLEDKFKDHNQQEEKISLQFYRDESKLIFNVVQKHFKQVEKGGCDEAYIQLTKQEMIELQKYPVSVSGIILKTNEQQDVLEGMNEQEKILLQASHFVNDVRKEIYEKTQYRCSAGISFNKMLAKLGSAINKPNNQTIILERMLPQCIRFVRIEKIRGFGGKISNAFEQYGIQTIAQAQDLSPEEFNKVLSNDTELAHHVHQKINGIDHEEIRLIQDPKHKSIMSIKNVKRIEQTEKKKLEPMIDLIVCDMTLRVTDYYEDTGLVPTILNFIYLHSTLGQHQKSESIEFCLPSHTFKQTIQDTINLIMQKLPDSTFFPCIQVGLAARSFQPIKTNLQSFKFTLTQYVEKNHQERTLQEIDELVNPENYYICEQCDKKIACLLESSHKDFHFAQSIDLEVNPNKKRYKKAQSQQTVVQTVGQTDSGKNSIQKKTSNNSIQNYFQKKTL